MRKILYSLLIMAGATAALISCDDATNTTDGYVEAICTVNGNYIIPEASDTAYKISNMADFDLQSGDRGVMRIRYEYDTYYSIYNAKWSIDEVLAIIPTRRLTLPSEVDSDRMDSYIERLDYYTIYSKCWFWRGLQNLNVVYRSDGTTPEFAMTVSGLSNDTLQLALWADIPEGSKGISDLLTFDLSTADNMLTQAERDKIATLDSLYTNIKILMGSSSNTAKWTNVPGGKSKNPFKKQ